MNNDRGRPALRVGAVDWRMSGKSGPPPPPGRSQRPQGLAGEPLQQIIDQLAQIFEGLAATEGGNEHKDPEDLSLDMPHPTNSTVVLAGAIIAEFARGAKRRPPGHLPWGPTSRGRSRRECSPIRERSGWNPILG